MLTIGLTGGIGSGKTTVSDIFKSLGVPVIDSDIIAREVVEPGEPGLEGIIARFSRETLHPDGTLNRQHLRNLVFDDASARRDLEQILHPLIRARSQERVAGLNTPYAILSIPLLVETGQTDTVDRVLVVDCPEQVQIERICLRDGISLDKAKAILAAQCSRSQRLKVADDIIDNNQSVEEVAQRIKSLNKQYISMSNRP
jgi:dephospho-CoA kinase